MIKNILITSAVALLLSACMEDSTNEDGAQGSGVQTPAPVVPTTNPDPSAPPTTEPPANNPSIQFPGTNFDPTLTQPTADTPTNPDISAPGTGGKDDPQPVQPVPVDPGTDDTLEINSLINGTSLGDIDSAWRCEGATNTDPDQFFLLSFFSDGTGQLEVGGEIAFTRWTLDNNQIALREAVPYSVLISNIVFFSRTQFSADLLIVDTGTAAIECALVDFNGNLIVDDNPLPESPATPTSPSAPNPDIEPVNSGTNTTLINGRTVSTLETFWFCSLSAGEELLLGFAADGNGVYADEDFPDGLALTWTENQSVQIFIDGSVVVTLSQPLFETANEFFVNSVTVDNEDFGGMACGRIDTNGNPIT